MKTSDFDYVLDPARIAQVPANPRDSARLLYAPRDGSPAQHLTVRDLPQLLAPGDLLVVNDTRVIAARLFGRRASGAAVELLLVERLSPRRWRARVQPAGRLKPGERVELEHGALFATMVERPLRDDGSPGDWCVELAVSEAARDATLDAVIESHGRLPLPHYIARERDGDARDSADRDDYQTVFAREPGAIAAPTAGLHFTPELIARLEQRGVELARVTLHVGEGTFQPVAVDDPLHHPMHAERYVLPQACARAVERTRERKGRVIAVGTTSARTLETCAGPDRSVVVGSGTTRLFLHPAAPPRVIDGLFTNFHLPRSTLLMLVAAFAGRERVLDLYAQAQRLQYRFYSYGDAMLIL